MAKTTRTLVAGLMVMTGLAGAARPAAAADVDAQAAHRVRSGSPAIRARIEQASEQSKTFRRLLETIEATDGIVYVEEGVCGNAVRACLTNVEQSGPNRVLLVKIEPSNKSERDLMESIGHELRHTIEVLENPKVTNRIALFFFYDHVGQNSGKAFETNAAIEAGHAVRDEVRRAARYGAN